MSINVDTSSPAIPGNAMRSAGPALSGVWQRILFAAWVVIFLLSLLSAVLSISNLNLWDRIPAGELLRYFPLLDPDWLPDRAAFQSEVMASGFSLAGFAFLLTLFRAVSGLAAFLLSILLIRRYPNSLMAVLFACLLAVVGSAGVWQNTMFGMATLRAPWMEIPTQLLNVLLWFGLIFLYAFPDGRFTPRWTIGLVILLIPIVLAIVFDLPIFLNPGTWPGLLALLPNVIFIGAAFFSILYRYHTADPARKSKLKGFVVGGSLLMTMYFAQLFFIDAYQIVTGHGPFNTNRALLTYVLINEPLWYVLVLVFVAGSARSLLRDRLLEG